MHNSRKHYNRYSAVLLQSLKMPIFVRWTIPNFHYVLRGGGSEKCFNLQKLLNTSGPLGWVMICSTLRGCIFHILWPFYCHLMVFYGPEWPYLTIGSPSDPRWIEHWVNRFNHFPPHPGVSVWAFKTTRKCHWWAPQLPKMAFFGQKRLYLAIGSPSVPKWVWSLNIILHIRGDQFGPLRPHGVKISFSFNAFILKSNHLSKNPLHRCKYSLFSVWGDGSVTGL